MARALVFLFVLLPWLNPFSPGPTPAVAPFLFAWTCTSLVVFIVAANNIGHNSLFRCAASAWFVAAGLSGWIGLMQYFGATDWAGPWIDHTGLGEAYGNLRQRNQFATLMNLGLAALVWRTSGARRASASVFGKLSSSAPITWYLGITGATLLSFANAASSSRTGLVQLVVLVCLALVWQRRLPGQPDRARSLRHQRQLVVAAVAGYAIATFLLPWIAGLDPFSSSAWARLRSGDALCASRKTLWSNVLYLIAQKPWTGWGWGELDYAHFITLYPGARFCDILDNAHNLPLHIAVEFGLPAAVAMCSAMLGLIWVARPHRETNTARQLAWAVLLVVGLHSFLEYPLWYGPFQTATLMSIWLLWSTSMHSRTVAPFASFGVSPKLARSLVAMLAIAVITACGYAGWQYQLVSQIYLPQSSRMTHYKEDTLEKLNGVSLFRDQVRFADLTTTDVEAGNAQLVHDLAIEMLHFSPEPRVAELILDSATLLGQRDDVSFYAARYKAAFPDAYAQWLARRSPGTEPL